jgi:Protein of unknown function (DUF2865)
VSVAFLSLAARLLAMGARLLPLAALFACAFIAADAQQVADGVGAGSPLDVTVASRAGQLALLNRNIHRWGCDRPIYATSVEGCRELNAQVASMAAEIEALKARAGGRWTEPDSAAPAPSAERATVAPARLSVAPPAALSPPAVLAPQAALSPPAPLTPRPAPRSEEIPFPQAQAAASPPHKPYTFWRRTSPSSSYRTLCVRLCDGFYYPVSYATRPGSFADEDKQCQSTCSAPAKLFYHANPGEAVEQMVALDGERYADLPNALRYRTEYVENCRCRPAPWSAEAKAEFDKRAVVAEQTEAERIVSVGATEVARIMAGGNVEIAENAPAGGRSPYYNRGASYGQGAYRPPLFARFRTPRYSYGTSPQAPSPQQSQPPRRMGPFFQMFGPRW